MTKSEITHWLNERYNPHLDYPEAEITELAERLWQLDFDGTVDDDTRLLIANSLGLEDATDAWLVNYDTTARVRRATPAELARAIEAERRDGGVGAIEVDGVTVYVER